MSTRYSISPSVATAIAQICCFQGRLPIGAPTSGIISNIVAGPLDSRLLRLAKRNRLRYTRYVDDITFSASSAGHLTEALGIDFRGNFVLHGGEHLSEDFKSIISEAGFSVNEAKVWCSSRQARQQVTGLITNRKVNIPIGYFKQTRSMVHSIVKYGPKKANELYKATRKAHDSDDIVSHVHGRLAYIGYIVDYNDKYTRVARKSVLKTGRLLPMPLLDREKATYVIETTPNRYQGTAVHIGDGYFLTASHTFDNVEPPGETGPGEEWGAQVFSPEHYPHPVPCKIINRDKDTDAALLRATSIASEQRPSLKLVTRSISIGESAKGFGYANYQHGANLHTVTANMSASRDLFGKQRSEVDKPWPHGMSGGPVFDENGLFLGIIFSGPKHGTDANPVGTAFTPYRIFSEQLEEWLAVDKLSR